MDLLTRDTVQRHAEWHQCRKAAENIMGHESKNIEVGGGRGAQVEVIPHRLDGSVSKVMPKLAFRSVKI